MRKIIHHIRKQPEHIKIHILHVSTVIAGIILVTLWVYSLGTNFEEAKTQIKTKQEASPISALKENIIDGYNSITTGQE
jgi:putative Mn2+ efflux pump MntP